MTNDQKQQALIEYRKVNSYMTSLGFTWKREAKVDIWFKGSHVVTQSQAADLYNAILRYPVDSDSQNKRSTGQPDTHHVDIIDEIVGNLACENFNRGVNCDDSILDISVSEAKAQLRAYIADEISKAKMQGFQEGRYAETHPEILTKYE